MDRCPHADHCRMCQLWHLTPAAEMNSKRSVLNELAALAPFEVFDFSPFQFRHRMDFLIHKGRLGLPSANPSENIFTSTNCVIVSEKIRHKLQELLSWEWPFTKGTLRLREDLKGEVGGWLDVPNAELLKSLHEESFLRRLLAVFPAQGLEVGQKRKLLSYDPPTKKSHPFRLTETLPGLWWQTWLDQKSHGLRSQALHLPIGAFSQPSFFSNRALLEICHDVWRRSSCQFYLEFGAGAGNFAVAAADHFAHGLAIENDRTVLSCLQANLIEHKHFQVATHLAPSSWGELAQGQRLLALVNPPRSGLGRHLSEWAAAPIDEMIYVSCQPSQFLREWPILSERFQLQKIFLVNQFPRTQHFEAVFHLSKIS